MGPWEKILPAWFTPLIFVRLLPEVRIDVNAFMPRADRSGYHQAATQPNTPRLVPILSQPYNAPHHGFGASRRIVYCTECARTWLFLKSTDKTKRRVCSWSSPGC